MNAALKALQLKARHQVYTLLSGHNLSKLHGEGYDFSELREYQIGDDIRKINWTITAKLGKPYIKELHANRELSVVVAAFMDASLYFGTGNAKQKKLTEVATLLGYAAQQNNDLFTGIQYTQNQTNQHRRQNNCITLNNSLRHSMKLLYSIILYPIVVPYKTFSRDYHKPSLVFVLSDFLEEVDLSLLSQKHEVIAVMIRDREEEIP